MNLFYVTDARLPTEKAHGYQIFKLCEALGRAGHAVAVVVPDRPNAIGEDPFLFYGVEPIFGFVRLPYWRSAFSESRFGYYFRKLLFIIALCRHAFPRESIIFTRDPEIVLLFNLRGFATVYNAHNWSRKDAVLSKLFPRTQKIVANSKGTAGEFTRRGFRNVAVVYNAVDLSEFERSDSKEALRAETGVPRDKKIVLYAGHLYAWKGALVVLEAAELLRRRSDIAFVMVGGTSEDVERFRRIEAEKGIDNVLLMGHRKRREIPAFLMSADVLLLPNIPSTRESELYTSPLKLFEYMASGVPIIASDLPSLREILDENKALLVSPGDAGALAGAVEHLLDHDTLASRVSVAAKRSVGTYTWEHHARTIVDFIQQV